MRGTKIARAKKAVRVIVSLQDWKTRRALGMERKVLGIAVGVLKEELLPT